MAWPRQKWLAKCQPKKIKEDRVIPVVTHQGQWSHTEEILGPRCHPISNVPSSLTMPLSMEQARQVPSPAPVQPAQAALTRVLMITSCWQTPSELISLPLIAATPTWGAKWLHQGPHSLPCLVTSLTPVQSRGEVIPFGSGLLTLDRCD